MDATPTDFLLQPDAGDLAADWTALHAAAEVVASLAGLGVKPAPELGADSIGGWRLDLLRQGIGDIAAMMEPGLAALLTLHGQGGDPRPAAAALWREFDRARRPLLALTQAARGIA